MTKETTIAELPAVQIKLSDLHLNTGQIKDVPKNPRFIKDERFKALKRSIEDNPEMIALRELVAYDNDGELVIIMGNMRYRAMREIGIKQAPTKVLPKDTSAKNLRAYIQKDNIGFGANDWEALGNDWDVDELQDFGLECDFLTNDDGENLGELLEDALNGGEAPGEADKDGACKITVKCADEETASALTAYLEANGYDYTKR